MTMTEQVKQWCREQCVMQHATTPEDFAGMEAAWDFAKYMNIYPLRIGVLRDLASMIDPVANPAGRFRSGPAVFMDGGTAAPAQDIPMQLDQLFHMWDTFFIDDADNFYTHLMWIHPFKDGNGRVGALAYNMIRGTIDNPVVPPAYK